MSVSNDGDAAENDIVVTALLPPGLSLVQRGTFGPDAGVTFQQQAGQVRFSPLAELPPKATKSYRITITTARPGPIELKAEATSRRQTQPVRDSTTVVVPPE